MQKKLLFVISQFYHGGAEITLLNLFKQLSPEEFDIDFLIFNQSNFFQSNSLVEYIPQYVNTIDFIEKTQNRIWKNNLQKLSKAQSFIKAQYDFAFHIGEWWAPEFVAIYVNAKYKAIWLHNDLKRISNFAKNEIEQYSHCFENYIFVSKSSMIESLGIFPYMQQKSVVIHNLIDVTEVKKKSLEMKLPQDKKLFDTDLPILVTVANIRPEKQHINCVEAMHILKDRGIKFKWFNIGTKSDKDILKTIEKKVTKYGLEDHFILLDYRANPYSIINDADAVAVCSFVESWSLVITEALSLGVPIIATPTSGANEQLTDGKNGVISSGFSAEDIANAIERFINIRNKLCASLLYDFSLGVNEFIQYLGNVKHIRTIIYLADDINYIGGANKATIIQIKHMLQYYYITLISRTKPEYDLIINELEGIQIVFYNDYEYKTYIDLSTKDVLLGNYTIMQKIFKSITYMLKIFKIHSKYIENLIAKMRSKLVNYLETFDNVVSLSENSEMRNVVAILTKPKKIQWIHQNYKCFYNWSRWTNEITKNDATLYSKYDAIISLSEICRNDFLEIHPHLKNKVLIIRNYSPVIPVNKYVTDVCLTNKKYFNIITIARLDEQKNVFGYLTIAQLLRGAGITFHWYIVGDGPLKSNFDSCISLYNLNEQIITTGSVNNPYPLLSQCDLFVLFSFCEGTPVTIEEAQKLHIPVIAKRVGGIPDQIDDGITGWLIDGDETDCYIKIMYVIKNPSEIQNVKKNLLCLTNHDNDTSIKLKELFG